MNLDERITRKAKEIMGENFGKTLREMKVSKGTSKKSAISAIAALAEKAHARWIPVESIGYREVGYLTERQASWLTSQLARSNVHVDFIEVKNWQ